MHSAHRATCVETHLSRDWQDPGALRSRRCACFVLAFSFRVIAPRAAFIGSALQQHRVVVPPRLFLLFMMNDFWNYLVVTTTVKSPRSQGAERRPRALPCPPPRRNSLKSPSEKFGFADKHFSTAYAPLITTPGMSTRYKQGEANH